MSVWRARLRQEIRRQVALTAENKLTRQALLEGAREWFPEVSTGKTPEQTVSRVLQELRALGELEFVARGVYAVVLESEEETAERERVFLAPKVLPGERRWRPTMLPTRPFQPNFRSYVLPNFGFACAVCGLAPEWFLDAAHLRPVGTHPDLAGDPSAGVAMCKNHHKALDQGLLVIEKDLTLSVSRRGLSSTVPELDRLVFEHEGRKLQGPRHFELNPLALPSIGAAIP